MTFSKPSVVKNASGYNWELNRFCSKLNTIVIGGANKLLNLFKSKYKTQKIITFCDLRWGTGNVYEKMGFKFLNETNLNYYYIGKLTNWKRKHRYTYAKHKLLELFPNSNKDHTEKEIAEYNGLFQIYDCGHLKFELIC